MKRKILLIKEISMERIFFILLLLILPSNIKSFAVAAAQIKIGCHEIAREKLMTHNVTNMLNCHSKRKTYFHCLPREVRSMIASYCWERAKEIIPGTQKRRKKRTKDNKLQRWLWRIPSNQVTWRDSEGTFD